MIDRDTAIAVLSNAIVLAGLLLLFSGLLFTRAESYKTKRGDKFGAMARFVLVPVLSCLALAWASICALRGNQWMMDHLLTGFEIILVLTAVFAIIGVSASP